MAPYIGDDYEEDEEEFSDNEDDDDLFDEDMDALRRACMRAGADPPPSSSAAAAAVASDSDGGDSSDTDNLEFFKSMRQKLAMSADIGQPLSLKPLCSMMPPSAGVSDDDEDDVFETFRAIQRRFAAYDSNALNSSKEHHVQRPEQVRASSIPLEKEISNNLIVNRTNACEGFPDFEGTSVTSQNLEPSSDMVPMIQSSDHIEWDQFNAHQSLYLPPKCSNFPKSAQVFIDAIRKNRSCQKLLRSKLTLIEARIEMNQKLKERVKVLKNFQVSCRRRSGRALSQKKDLRAQLILAPKAGASKDSKVNDRKAVAMSYGPSENSHVANYRMVLKKCPFSFCRLKWSTAERGTLVKGLRQEYQKALLEKSVELLSGSDNIDDIIASIKDLEITDENIRLYLRNVDWNNFASIYTKGRSGAECEARWLNYEDPLINHNPWSLEEDKILRIIVQQRGSNNWIDTAVSLGTNRTPFQCLARYQRSLNPYMMKREWTKDEDAQLCIAVDANGEGNWQIIASNLEGRTGTQCSNRWKKSLHPAKQRRRWSQDEDKHLKVAVLLFGPKTWQKIARFVPGRTQEQCRERWLDSLDPSINWDKWTEDEDRRLLEAIEEHNYSWSKVAPKVASCTWRRTDSQCLRRWKQLCPDDVPKLQAARKIKKVALMSNFVDRESERPTLGPKDFVPLALIKSTAECENANASRKPKRNSRKLPKKIRSARPRKEVSNDVSEMASSDGCKTFGRSAKGISCLESSLLMITNSEEVEAIDGLDPTTTWLTESSICTEPTACQSSLMLDSQIINGGGAESFNGKKGFSTKKKRAPKRPVAANMKSPRPHLKRTNCYETAGSRSLPLMPPQSSEAKVSNGDGVDTCGNNITSTGEKRTFNQPDNAKKKSPKQCSKRKRCTDITENPNVLPLTAQSLDPEPAKPHYFTTSHGNDITLPKKKLAPKRHPRSIVSEQLEEHQNVKCSSGKSIVNGTTIAADRSPLYQEPTLSMMINGVETCGNNITSTGEKRTFNQPDNAKKKSPKQCPKRKRCTDITENHNVLPLTAQSLDPQPAKPRYHATSHENDITSPKKKLAPNRHPRKIVSEQLEEHQNVKCSSGKFMINGTAIAADRSPVYQEPTLSMMINGKESIFCGRNTTVKMRAPKCSFNPEAACNSTELPAPDNFPKENISNSKKRVCKQQHKRGPSEENKDCASIVSPEDEQKKSMNKDKSCSEQVLGKIDEDDIPLACMVNSLSGKKKKFKNSLKVCRLLSRANSDKRQS